MTDLLYVEDDQDSRELGVSFLENEGHDVTPATNPEEAIQTYEDEDIIITDYLFKGEETGLDIYDETQPEEGFILFTGYQRDFVETDAGRDIPDDIEVLTKGGGFQELIEEVENLV